MQIGGVDEAKHFSLRWCFCSNVFESHWPVLDCAFNRGSRFLSQASPEAFVLGPFEAYERKLLIEWPGDARFENNSARGCGGRPKMKISQCGLPCLNTDVYIFICSA
jgi:hypothetical protein